MRYAQIDIPTGICVSVSHLSGEVTADHMIPLAPEDDVQPGDIYDGEAWTRPDPPEPDPPEPDRITQLEDESALLALELADTQIRLDQTEREQADLLLALVAAEVI